MKKNFPEMPRTSHAPDGMKPGYTKSSQGTDCGHEQFDSRMPHPFSEAPPMNESGEGKGTK